LLLVRHKLPNLAAGKPAGKGPKNNLEIPLIPDKDKLEN